MNTALNILAAAVELGVCLAGVIFLLLAATNPL